MGHSEGWVSMQSERLGDLDAQHYKGVSMMTYVTQIIGWRPHEICLHCQPHSHHLHQKMVHLDLHCMHLN